MSMFEKLQYCTCTFTTNHSIAQRHNNQMSAAAASTSQKRNRDTCDAGQTLPKRAVASWADVVVVVGGEEFRESSHLLRHCSDYFDAAFRSGMKEATTMRFEFPDKDPEDWKLVMAILDPLPTVTLFDDDVTLYKVLPWFDELLIPKGMAVCDEVLELNMSRDADDVLEKLSTSLKYNLPKTKDKCFELLRKRLRNDLSRITSDQLKLLCDIMASQDECRQGLWTLFDRYFPDPITDPAAQQAFLANGVFLTFQFMESQIQVAEKWNEDVVGLIRNTKISLKSTCSSFTRERAFKRLFAWLAVQEEAEDGDEEEDGGEEEDNS
jgi:BTB/POZ domain